MRCPDWMTEDGTVQLYFANCLDVVQDIQAGSVDCVLDPPYGIREAAGKNKKRGLLAQPTDYGEADWDNSLAIDEVEATRAVSDGQVVFGGNFYPLPPASCVLVWDKMNGDTDFADCELAWTNNSGAVRLMQFRWNGMLRDEKGPRYHPTQKPIAVMKWAIKYATRGGKPILDSMMGSGTTGVAALRCGLPFIGIERNRQYFDIAVLRIERELSRHPMIEKPVKAQGVLIDRSKYSLSRPLGLKSGRGST